MTVEVQFDFRLHLHRLAIEQSGLVAPLTHGLGGGLGEDMMTAQGLGLDDAAVTVHHNAEANLAFQFFLLRFLGILRFDLLH